MGRDKNYILIFSTSTSRNMIFLIGFLLILLVGGYIGYPLFVKKIGQQTYTNEQLRSIEEEIEREILVLRKYPDNNLTI